MNYNKDKTQFIFYFFLFISIISFALGIYLGRSGKLVNPVANGFSNTEEFAKEDLDLLDEVWDKLDDNYVGEMPNKEEAMEGAARGLVYSVDDPYTMYFSEEETTSFKDDMQGSFEGIGAEVGIRDGVITIIAPLDDMPAKKAGLKAGDKVMKIEDEMTTDMSLEEAVKKIKGPKGTTVKLTIVREGLNEPLVIEITRGKIDIKSVKWELKENNIAYIRLSGFVNDTSEEFEKMVEEVRKSKAKKIVLDLRNNPGGLLHSSVDIAGYFLKKGTLVAMEDYGEKNKLKNRKNFTKRTGVLKDYPIIILVDNGTASAAEILAGALRDQRQVKLIGVKTFGKGSVQEMKSLDNGGSVKITVAKWLTPKGVNLSENGLEPDIEVKAQTQTTTTTENETESESESESSTQEDQTEPKDIQLERAIEELKKLGN
jgi:carboxyl-terminal processing protease